MTHYRVLIRPHRVTWPSNGAHWDVPEKTYELAEKSLPRARLLAARWSHRDVGIPPFRSLVRQTYNQTVAEEYVPAGREKEAKMRDAQRKRDAR